MNERRSLSPQRARATCPLWDRLQPVLTDAMNEIDQLFADFTDARRRRALALRARHHQSRRMTTFQPPRAGERMIPVEEAQQRVLAEVSLVGTETVAFTEAPGRVLREDVRATNDVPQGDNTAMDGY